MKSKIKTFIHAYFFGIGISTILLVFACYVMKLLSPEKGMDILAAMTVAFVPSSFLCTLLFKEGLPARSLWFRRAIVIIISCIEYPACFIAFGIVKFESITKYATYILISVCAVSIGNVIAYVIADMIEQRKIKKINEKLKKDNFDK